MSEFEAGAYVKILARPLVEARRIMAVVDASERPLQCLPASQVIADDGFLAAPPIFEYYAYAEVRIALAGEYSIKPVRALIVDALWKSFRDFKQFVAQERQFEAFNEVVALFQKDPLAGPMAQQVLNAAITKFNAAQPAYKQWSTIWTDFASEPAVPEISLERFKVALDTIAVKYINAGHTGQ